MSDELNNIEEVEEISLDEDAAASNQATIAAKPTNVSRSDLLSRMVSYASQLNKDDLSQAMVSMGVPENDEIYANNSRLATGDMSGKNKASIKSSNAIKEDLALLFGDSSLANDSFISSSLINKAI